MISGIVAGVGNQPLRTRGIFFKNGNFGGVHWRAIQTTDSAAGAADTMVLNIHPSGNLIAGQPPNGIWTNANNDPRSGLNARGQGSVDLQIARVSNYTSATTVASGSYSVIGGGASNTASGGFSCVPGGSSNTASGANSFCAGQGNTASNVGAIAIGYGNTASGRPSIALGQGALANRIGQLSLGGYSALGAMFYTRANTIVLSGLTTNATPLTLLATAIDNGSTGRLTVTSGVVMSCTIEVVGILSTGASVVKYGRKVCIKNVGGTTTLVGTVETIGADHEDDATCDVTITADDTNDALQINVTGPSSGTWRWVATVQWTELPYGS